MSEILFAFNQLIRCFKSALTSFFSFLIGLFRHNRLRSCIYNENGSDRRTDPWGTPQFIVVRDTLFSKFAKFCEKLTFLTH